MKNEYYILFSIIFNGLFVLKNPLNPIIIYNLYEPIKYPWFFTLQLLFIPSILYLLTCVLLHKLLWRDPSRELSCSGKKQVPCFSLHCITAVHSSYDSTKSMPKWTMRDLFCSFCSSGKKVGALSSRAWTLPICDAHLSIFMPSPLFFSFFFLFFIGLLICCFTL